VIGLSGHGGHIFLSLTGGGLSGRGGGYIYFLKAECEGMVADCRGGGMGRVNLQFLRGSSGASCTTRDRCTEHP